MRFLLFAVLLLAGCAASRPAKPLPSTLTYLTVAPSPLDSLAAWARAVDGLTVDEAPDLLTIRDARPATSGLTTARTVAAGGTTRVTVQTEYATATGRPLAAEWLSQMHGSDPLDLPLPADGSPPRCYTVEDWRRDTERSRRPVGTDPNADERAPELIGGLAGLSRRVVYPPSMRRAGVEGVAVIRFVVEEDGSVGCTEALLSPHPALTVAAIDAVRGSAFVPGTQGGVAVRVRYTVPLNFRLR